MDLDAHYKKLYSDSILKIQNNSYSIDPFIDSKNDTRFGITLLLRPPKRIRKEIQGFLDRVREIEPDQYYYPSTDIHITVMSIISCYEGFRLNTIKPVTYEDLIKKSCEGITPFSIEFKGVTASDSGVMIQGFPQTRDLERLRNNLRDNFSYSELEQSMDKRYTIQTAHSTVIRFKNTLGSPEKLISLLNSFRDFHFGAFQIKELELVFNDWYQKKDKVKTLAKFPI